MGTKGDSDVATVAERPGAKQEHEASVPRLPSEPTLTVADAGTVVDRPFATATRPATAPTTIEGPESPTVSTITTAADALHDEEIERTRLFIRVGWAISVASIGVVALLPSPRPMQIAQVAAMLFGIAVSSVFYRRWRDPAKFTERALFTLAIVCAVNAHVAVLYFGALTMAPAIVLIGLHFIGRTESVRTAKIILAACLVMYALLAALLTAGVFRDPGVFAARHELSASTQLIGAAFVLGAYVLGYITGVMFRRASLVAIDELAHATRVTSQREALMAELRADLERALRVGGPGRYTNQRIGLFKLGIVLGRGAMGEVYEASHVASGQAAAVKLLRRELLSDATHLARFMREAKAGGSLESEHVARVLEASSPDEPVPYIAMERLHGITLAEILRRESRLAPHALLELVKQAGEGIDAAAAAGIVHRDLKPQNLFRTEKGIWKILDFGVATLSEDSGALTQGGVIGTPSYMAPEQAQGKRVDGRADIYALAAVTFRCLTARYPFSGTDTPTLLYAVVHKMPPRPSSIAELPSDVDACLAIALAKDPEDRFASAAAFSRALTAAFAGALEPALKRRAAALLRRHPWEEPS